MRDIVNVQNGMDLGVASSDLPKAANVLSVQLGDLEYQPDFGVDKRYFLERPEAFQNESFKAYLVQRLAEAQINVNEVLETVETLFRKYTFYVRQDFDPANRFTQNEIIDNVLTDADGEYLLDADGSPLTDGL